MNDTDTHRPVTIRCPYCGTLNRVDLGRASQRPTCGECSRPVVLDRPLKVSEEDFDRTVLGARSPVLVDFYADWCGPCRMVAPVVDEIAQNHAGSLLVVKVDTDQAPGLSTRFGIRGIPTLILFRDGAEADRSVGFDPVKLRAMAEGVS